jgi:hypothetical protein
MGYNGKNNKIIKKWKWKKIKVKMTMQSGKK